MPPKTNKRKRSSQQDQDRLQREARERSLWHGYFAMQRTGHRNRAGVRGLPSSEQLARRTAKGYVDNINSQGVYAPNSAGIYNRHRSLLLQIERAKARGATGSATLHQRMLDQFEHQMRNPAHFQWDDDDQDFVARDPAGDYFWISDRGSRRDGDDDDQGPRIINYAPRPRTV